MLIQLETQCSKPKPRSVFYSYSHKDEDLRDELDAHLKLLKRDGFISTWDDRKIRPGDEWDHVINENLNTADVILFLVSHHFLASQYCRDIEVKRAMERYQKREAILIPIIIKPCVWTSEDFAKLQVLPKNCRPLAEWPDTGFAQVAEELRTMLVDMLYPQKPSEATSGQHGNWIIKLRSRPDVDSKARVQQVVARVREYTEDFTISLQATATTQILDGEKAQVGLMLILTGTPEAFAMLDKAQRDGQLAEAIDEDILSLYVIHGATVQSLSSVGASLDIGEVEGSDSILRPGKKIEDDKMSGVFVPKGDDGSLYFIYDRGGASEDQWQPHYESLIDYFRTALAVKEEFLWVNLSAYESDRMIPKELSGTMMGRTLLEEDCLLKRLTASFMHPDSPVGREYWDAVYAEARRLHGTSKLPFRSFQKVTIVPSKAVVYEGDGDDVASAEALRKEGKGHFTRPGHLFGYVTESALDVKCEEDLVAKTHNAVGQAWTVGDFTVELFRQIVLPRLRQEVNEGEHFLEFRRIYNAIILATFVRTNMARTHHSRLQQLVDSNNPKSVKFTIQDVAPLNGTPEGGSALGSSAKKSWVVEHLQPDALAFDIPENVEFFEKYVRLFKNGLFRCARNEAGDSPGDRIIRVYFSGAIDFRNLKGVICGQGASEGITP